jgi:zinc protease
MSCLTEHLDRAMALMADVVLEPTFPADEFEKLRRQTLTSLAVQAAEPEYLAEKELRRRLYPDHPYARTATGEPDDVNALAIEDLRSWYSGFARPDMAVLIIAGDIDPAAAFAKAQDAFGPWTTQEPKPQVNVPAVPALQQTHIYIIDKPGSVQSQIRIGRPAITRHDPGYFVSRIVSNYFGWSFDSRLNKSIRIEKGLTYGIWGGYVANRFAGDFQIGTFTRTESTAETIQAVLDEIQRLKTDPPTENELSDSQTYILGSFVRGRETPQQVAEDLWLIESQNLGPDYLDRLLKGIADATKKDCSQLVKNTMSPDPLIITVVGEAQKLKDPLQSIAPVTIITTQ